MEKVFFVLFVETSNLRTNIIRQFSKISQNITIEDIQESLLGLRITDEKTLKRIVRKFGSRRDVAMSTLMLSFIQSNNAIRAFVYALIIQENNPFEERLLLGRQQIDDANNSIGNTFLNSLYI